MADGTPGTFEIGRVISDTLRAVRGTAASIWPVVVGFVLAPQFIIGLIQVAFLPSRVSRFLEPAPSPLVASAIVGPVALLGLIAGVLEIAGSIALIYASANFLNGRTTTPAEAVRQALRLFLPILWVSLMIALCVGLASVLLIIPGLFLAVAWSVVLPVRIMEPISAMDALGRGYRLTASFRWPIVGVFLILFCIYFGLVLVLGAVAGVLGLIGLDVVSSLIVSPVLAALVAVIGAATPAAIYHELIRIKEGGGTTVAEVFS